MTTADYHLKGPLGFSGRCVRLRTLSGDQMDKYFDTCASLLGKDASHAQIFQTYRTYCIKATVVAVTPPESESATKHAGWEPVSFERAQTEFDKLFTAKDREMIGKIYSRYHELTTAEVDDIMGGAIPVATD